MADDVSDSISDSVSEVSEEGHLGESWVYWVS